MIQNRLPHDHGQTIEHELEYMPSVENFQTVADIFKQLGDGSRIRIFWLLLWILRLLLWILWFLIRIFWLYNCKL